MLPALGQGCSGNDGWKEPDVRFDGLRVRMAARGSGRIMTPRFFTPMGDGQAGEQLYQELRVQVETDRGRPPHRRRIREIWTRRGSLDCVTTVGDPDPVWGGVVTAIFDMGPHQPYLVYRRQNADAGHQSCDVLGCSAYSVQEFAA
jgi:hypothetical protein